MKPYTFPAEGLLAIDHFAPVVLPATQPIVDKHAAVFALAVDESVVDEWKRTVRLGHILPQTCTTRKNRMT